MDGERLSVFMFDSYFNGHKPNKTNINDFSFDLKQGFIILNGHNLGRYWPIAGPQITLYVPKEFLRKRSNSIVVVEMQKVPANRELKFSQHSIICYRSDKKSK